MKSIGFRDNRQKPLYRLTGRRERMTMNKPLQIFVLLVSTTFVGMIVWADLADAFTYTHKSANSSITNRPEPATSPKMGPTSGDGKNTVSSTQGAKMKNPMLSCYANCMLEVGGRDNPSGFLSATCQKQCGWGK
jgi:hypothetical protein